MSATPPPIPSDEQRRLELAAAEWLVKKDRGFTPAEQDEYFQWLAADPRHGEWLARHRATWQELNALAQWRPEHSAEPNPDLLAPTKFNRHRARVVWFWSGALAAAAGLALVFTVWNQPEQAVPLAPGPVQLAAQAYERRVLEDGSVIELNRGTRVAVDYTAAERRVRLLQGEALFTVAKNAARPFIVQAAGVDVRAIGTAFNVRLGAEDVAVLVTSGRVQVAPPPVGASSLTATAAAAAIPVLEAGDSVVVPLTSTNANALQVTRVTEDEVARQLAWQPKLLDFQSTPLAEVVAEFNRHGGPRLIIADPAPESLPIVLSFRSDNVEGFVRLLEMTADVRAERRGEAIVLRRAP
ncbi:MAG TPA: FecR domain-containing protein [Opitutaceae bacterium]|nr:FecR domain-containing protein [Opitutaceae bacterium]HRJ46756.1 FecR domain-containing protein [Opitutaceae bacterium]